MIFTLALKALTEVAYCAFGNDSVAWRVVYNFVDYSFIASASMLLVFVLLKSKDLPLFVVKIRTPIVWVSHLLGVYYWWYAFIELTYIGSSVEVYEAGGLGGLGFGSLLLLGAMAVYSYIKIYKFKDLDLTRRWI